MTHEEYEARRMKSITKDIERFVELFGEPEYIVTFGSFYFDVYAIYKECKADGWWTTRYRVYEDPSEEPECMKEHSIVFDMDDHMQWLLREDLIKTVIAANNHPDEPLSYSYECKAELVVHEKGWRPNVAEVAA